MKGWGVEWMDEWIDGWIDGEREGEREREMEGETEGWRDGRTNGSIITNSIVLNFWKPFSVFRYLKEKVAQLEEERNLEKDTIQKYEVINLVVGSGGVINVLDVAPVVERWRLICSRCCVVCWIDNYVRFPNLGGIRKEKEQTTSSRL